MCRQRLPRLMRPLLRWCECLRVDLFLDGWFLYDLNDALNLRRFHTGPDNWILFVWTRPVAKLLKNLVLMICQFFLLEPIPRVPRLLQLLPEVLVRASGSYGPT
jgi:hypothetical protein